MDFQEVQHNKIERKTRGLTRSRMEAETDSQEVEHSKK